MKKIIVLLFAIAFITGCMSTGSESIRGESVESIESKITRGVTTKTQVRGLLGSPLETSYTDSGLEIWKYKYSETKNEGEGIALAVLSMGLAVKQDADVKELTILFTDGGIVKNFNMSNSLVSTRGGLIR